MIALLRRFQLLLVPITIVGVYVLSVCWRVGVAEQQMFGRSYLPPITLNPPEYSEPATADSYANTTYTYERDGKQIHVYKQLINSFQHVLGSAFVSYETGSTIADLLFRCNEYAEAIVCRHAYSDYFYRDTKKDLANNALGRDIGKLARQHGLFGPAAERFIVEEALKAVDTGRAIKHFKDDRVTGLPTPHQYGCPGLVFVQRLHPKPTYY